MKGNFGLLFKNFSTTLLLFVYVLISLVLWQKCHTQSFEISCQYLPIAETRILSAWTSSRPFSAISISSKAYSSFNCLFLSKWVSYLLTRDSTTLSTYIFTAAVTTDWRVSSIPSQSPSLTRTGNNYCSYERTLFSS